MKKSDVAIFLRNRISELIKDNNLTQKQVSDLLNVDTRTVTAKLSERGDREVTLSEAVILHVRSNINFVDVFCDAINQFSTDTNHVDMNECSVDIADDRVDMKDVDVDIPDDTVDKCPLQADTVDIAHGSVDIDIIHSVLGSIVGSQHFQACLLSYMTRPEGADDERKSYLLKCIGEAIDDYRRHEK